MSHSENGSNGDGTHRDDDHSLHRFERNRFFNGKLMTARDMQAEQHYHAERLETVTSFVNGWGIVCGLDAKVEVPDGDDRPLVVVESGVAIDRAGRIIVVPDDHSEPLKESIGSTDEEVSIYLRHDTCFTESVPAHGSEDACKEECDYNRTVETYAVDVENRPPIRENEEGETVGEQKPLPFERVRFPTEDEVGKDVTTDAGRIANVNDAANLPARFYHELADDDPQFREVRDCETPEPGRVFLGHFESNDDGVWSVVDYWDEETEHRPYVYTNDMLYTSILDHATDFENPHELALSAFDVEEGAGIGIDSPEVTLAGRDGTTIGVDGSLVTISGGGAPDALDPVVEYYEGFKPRLDALREVACVFEALRDQFEYVPASGQQQPPTRIADALATLARRGLADDSDFAQVYEEPTDFVEFVDQRLIDGFDEFLGSLPDFVGNTKEYDRALSTLEDLVNSLVNADISNEDGNSVAIELRRLAETAACLSGHCIGFGHLDDFTPVTSPLTLKDVVVDPKLVQVPSLWEFVPTVVPFDGGTALEFLDEGLRIELPPTNEVVVTVRKGRGFTLTALDEEENQIGSDTGDAPRDTTETLTVATGRGGDPITALELTYERGEKQTLVPDEEGGVMGRLSDEQRERLRQLATGQLLSVCLQ